MLINSAFFRNSRLEMFSSVVCSGRNRMCCASRRVFIVSRLLI